jgi:hypothetical protein
MPLPILWVKKATSLVANHLKRHEMAGLPHINVLGSSTEHEIQRFEDIIDEEDSDFLVFDTAYTSNEPEWRFMPNRAMYQITVEPFRFEPLKTQISFFIRIRDGCDDDLLPNNKVVERYKKTFITEEELKKAFKKVQITIETFTDFREPVVEVLEEGKKTVPDFNVETEEHLQAVIVRYKTQSDYFLVYEEGTPKLIQQNYMVYVRKVFKKIEQNYRINVEVRNLSPKTSMSRIPDQELLEKLKDESRDT